jgi:hypothetical protein
MHKTKWEKEKEKGKGFSTLVGWGENSGLARCRCARGRERAGPARPKGGRRHGRARKRRRGHGAHAPGRVGGETASATDGAGANRPTRGENPAAGGFNGDSPPVTRFLGIGQVPKHEEGLTSLRVGPILPGEAGRELTAVRWRSSTAGVVAGEVWVVIGGRGAVFRVHGDVAKLLSLVNFSLNIQRRGGGEEELTRAEEGRRSWCGGAREGEKSGRGRCGSWRSSGRPFGRGAAVLGGRR